MEIGHVRSLPARNTCRSGRLANRYGNWVLPIVRMAYSIVWLAPHPVEMGPAISSRIFHTQKMALALAQSKTDGESVARFVSMHDFFVKNHQIYASREDWVLKVIEVLWKAKRAKDVAARADALAGQTKSKEILLAALRFSLRARESLVGLTSEPRFVRNKKLSGDEETAQAYVVTLDKMQEVVTGRELEQSQFQAVFVTQVIGQNLTWRSSDILEGRLAQTQNF